MNLKDYYTKDQVIALLGLEKRCRGIARLNGGQMLLYPRSEIDKYLWEDARPGDIIKINEKLIGIPAYNLDLTEWIPFAEAIRIVPFADDMVQGTTATNDLLKPIRSRRVYGNTFYNKRDLLKLLAVRSEKRYYTLSHVDVMAISGEDTFIPITDRAKIAAWFSPREAQIVVGYTLRHQRSHFKDIKWFGRCKFIYSDEVLNNITDENGIHRASYIYTNRLYDPDLLWQDWLSLKTIQSFTYWSRGALSRLVHENNIEMVDLGGIMAYNKAQWINWFKGQIDDMYLPFTSKVSNNRFENKAELLEYVNGL